VQYALFTGGILASLGGILLVSALLPPLRFIYRGARQDWTRLSFIVYGGAIFIYLVDFDEYSLKAPFQAVAVAALALGAVRYLRGAAPRRRILALVIGVAAAFASMAVGKWLLVPLQDWPFWVAIHPAESERWFEAGRSLLGGAISALALLAPAALAWFPQMEEPAR
jgi:hypothetical protein